MRNPTGQVVTRERKGGRTYALRFHCRGRRHFITLGTAATGWTAAKAEAELANVLADIRRGIWQPPEQDEPADEPKPEQSFHEFASRWLEGRRPELRPRSVEALTWALSGHLLSHFADFLLSDISAEEVDRYKLSKVREREAGLVARPLSNGSINRTIATLAAVLDAAVEYGHLASNPARGKRRRLKASKPRRGWLELDEVRSILRGVLGRTEGDAVHDDFGRSPGRGNARASLAGR